MIGAIGRPAGSPIKPHAGEDGLMALLSLLRDHEKVAATLAEIQARRDEANAATAEAERQVVSAREKATEIVREAEALAAVLKAEYQRKLKALTDALDEPWPPLRTSVRE